MKITNNKKVLFIMIMIPLLLSGCSLGGNSKLSCDMKFDTGTTNVEWTKKTMTITNVMNYETEDEAIKIEKQFNEEGIDQKGVKISVKRDGKQLTVVYVSKNTNDFKLKDTKKEFEKDGYTCTEK